MNKHPEKQRRGPLRDIVKDVYMARSGSIFEPIAVILSCGHQVRSWGGRQARCDKCLQNPDSGEQK